MKRLIYTLLAFIIAVSKVILPLVIGMILACLLCNIQAGENYSWLSGIWHGMFFIPNLLQHMVDSDVLYKATNYTMRYNFCWWIVSIVETIMTLPLALFVVITPLAALTTPKKDLEEIDFN